MKYLAFLCCLLLILIGCSKLTNQLPNIDAGSDQIVEVGQKASLKGIVQDQNNDPMVYKWQVLSRPQHSKSEINNSEKLKALFFPDVMGVYLL